MPRVSIGLPVFNGEKYLPESLDSVLAQTYGDFELIISDNASTDRTAEICNEYALKDQRIRYSRNESNLGAAANYNRVFRLATAPYFRWVSHDDLSAPELLERCVDILDRFPDVVLCYPKTVVIDAAGRPITKHEDDLHLRQERPHERLSKYISAINLANSVFGLIRSDALRRTRLIGPYSGSDLILLMELCMIGKYHEIPAYLFFRRDHEGNVRKLPIEERGKWFDPNLRKSFVSPRTMLVVEMFRAVKQADLAPYEKMLCYMQIRRWEIRKWRATAGRYKARMNGWLFGSDSAR